MSNSEVVLVDSPAPHVARLLINRPDKRNAIDHDVRQALTEALTALQSDSKVRALVFGGVGGMFSAGGDLPSMQGLNESQIRERMQHIHVLCRLVASARIPVVSAIEGFGAGAAIGLALLGDYIVVGEGTKILFPFLRLGLTPDWGQLLTLPRRVGLPMARRIGLADTQVTDASVMDAAINKAAEMAQLPLEAFARMKDRLNQVSASLVEELAREESDQVVCLLTDDFVEGFDAFKTKRVANFIGKSRYVK
jgi:enoyl-CoA hydratase/carnithine racemase